MNKGQSLRTVSEPIQFWHAGIEPWTCHSEMVLSDALMQCQFWARMTLAYRNQRMWWKKNSWVVISIIPKGIRNPQLSYHCPFININSRAQLSAVQIGKRGDLGPTSFSALTLLISTVQAIPTHPKVSHGDEHRIFLRVSNFFTFLLALSILNSVEFLGRVMNLLQIGLHNEQLLPLGVGQIRVFAIIF